MRFFGCVIIIAVCMAIGRTLALGYIERVKNLQVFITAFEILRSRIGYGQEILEVAFSDIGLACNNKVGQIFLDMSVELSRSNVPVSEIWHNKISDSFKNLDFNFEDEEILLGFGSTLGSGDVDNTIRNINLTVDRLKTQLQYANDDKAKYAKLYRNIGGIGGTLLAIIVI